MRNYELTRVWEIDDKLFVANTIEDAIALWRDYSNSPISQPENVRSIASGTYLKKYDAVIKAQNVK